MLAFCLEMNSWFSFCCKSMLIYNFWLVGAFPEIKNWKLNGFVSTHIQTGNAFPFFLAAYYFPYLTVSACLLILDLNLRLDLVYKKWHTNYDNTASVLWNFHNKPSSILDLPIKVLNINEFAFLFPKSIWSILLLLDFSSSIWITKGLISQCYTRIKLGPCLSLLPLILVPQCSWNLTASLCWLQISYLQKLGCTVAPTSRLHASRLIEQYKSLWLAWHFSLFSQKVT